MHVMQLGLEFEAINMLTEMNRTGARHIYELQAFHREGAPELLPPALLPSIDAANAWVSLRAPSDRCMRLWCCTFPILQVAM